MGELSGLSLFHSTMHFKETPSQYQRMTRCDDGPNSMRSSS